jgi:hypothetical protein
VAVDAAGDIYISDSDSHIVRKVNVATGVISTVVGISTAGYAGDGGPATSAQLNVPEGILLDDAGNRYIADSQSSVIRKVDVSNPPSLIFASTQVGATSAAQDVTVMNLGNAPMTISPISAAANFSLAGTDTSCNLSSGQTLSPAATCVLGIEFAPATAGNLSGSIILTDNSNSASQTIALTGAATTQTAQTETYTLTAQTPTVSVNAGSSGTATLNLSSSNYAGTVTFATTVTSTDGTPADVTATATSVTLTAGGIGTSTVTIAANMSAANHTPSAPWNGGGTVMICAFLLGAPFTFRRKRLLAAFPLVLAISLAGFMMACGAVGSSTQPHTQNARTYVVTVTPTAAASAAGSVTVTNPAPVSITVTVP